MKTKLIKEGNMGGGDDPDKLNTIVTVQVVKEGSQVHNRKISINQRHTSGSDSSNFGKS